MFSSYVAINESSIFPDITDVKEYGVYDMVILLKPFCPIHLEKTY